MNFKDTLKLIPKIHKTTLVPLLMGHTGIGKTELVTQYAASIGFNLVVIHMASIEPSDFIGLYKVTEDGLTMTCPPDWMPRNKGANSPKGVEVVDCLAGQAPKGFIVFLDEINRAPEDMRQSCQQFILTKKIHTYEAPMNTFIVAAANQADQYECYEFDDALMNKFAVIDFVPDPDETLKHLDSKHGNNLFLTWLQSDKALLEIDSELKTGEKRLTPRVAENAMLLFLELENESAIFQRMALETVIPKDKVASFLSFLDEIKHINYVDVLNGVKGDKIKDLLKRNRRDILSTIVHDIGKLSKNYENGVTKLKKEVDGLKATDKDAILNMANFLNECPSELVALYLNLLGDSYSKKSSILTIPEFKNVLEDKLRDFKEVFKEASSKK